MRVASAGATGNVGAMVRGAAGGLVATAAMSAVMLAVRRLGLVSKLAPEHVTEAGLDAADVDSDEPAENAASTVAHLAFGAGAGAAYALVAPRLPGPALVRGLTYAAGVLLVSYEGWVPAASILPPLREQTPAGRWTLIASHAVYGATLGLVVDHRRS